MFSILRRLRNRALGEPRLGKVWRYAIGEFLLLVVGILLALQINNWKEQYADRQQEAYYLQRLLDDFEANDAEAGRNITFSVFLRYSRIIPASLRPVNRPSLFSLSRR